ncbi:MAG: prepilin-type N-terminal cleavage/methylation domain-containing protein [Victivallaceae bacterium]|nr:prepilin-type N-terminal cleavage/methylation domain-containing protein [Victivallaceae bacterium]
MRKSEAGFTLFEVVLALAIFAVASLLTGSTLYAMQRSWKKIRVQSVRLKTCQSVDRVLDYAFRNAVPFKWQDKNLKESLVFKGDRQELILAYLHRVSNVKNGGIRFIKFCVENGNLTVYYRPTPILYWLKEDLESACSREIIARDVEKISFLYADRNAESLNWEDAWDEEKEKNIPLAIQMTVEFKDGSKVSWLRRTAGNSYETTYGKRETVIK